MNIQLKAFLAVAAMAMALIPQAEAQNNSHIPGTVVAWGNNGTGQTTVPGGLTGVVAIAAGTFQSLALVATPPALVIQASSDNILLSWPLSASGFAVQSTTNLTDNNSWTTLTNLPVMVDSQNRVTETISGSAKFYRLKK